MRSLCPLALVALLAAPAFAQTMVQLFARELPPSVFRDENAIVAVELQLRQKSEIDPDLLLPYLRYLQAAFGTSADSARALLFRTLKARESAGAAARNAWMRERAAEIGRMDLTDRVREAASAYFTASVTTVYYDTLEREREGESETKRADYLVVKNYRRDSTMAFDPETDYRAARAEAEAGRRIRVAASLGGPEARSDGRREEEGIRELLSQWHLFSGEEGAGSFDAAAAVVRAVRASHSVARASRFSLAPSYSFGNGTFSAPAAISIPTLALRVASDRTASVPQAGLSLGYRIFLKEYVDYLSYVVISVGYAKNLSDFVQDLSGVTRNVYTVSGELHEETVTAALNRVTITSAKSLALEARVPVFLIGRALVIEAGVHVSQNSLLYDHRYQYVWENRVTYPQLGGSYTETTRRYVREAVQSHASTTVVVRPSVEAQVRCTENITVRLGTSISALSAGVGIHW